MQKKVPMDGWFHEPSLSFIVIAYLEVVGLVLNVTYAWHV